MADQSGEVHSLIFLDSVRTTGRPLSSQYWTTTCLKLISIPMHDSLCRRHIKRSGTRCNYHTQGRQDYLNICRSLAGMFLARQRLPMLNPYWFGETMVHYSAATEPGVACQRIEAQEDNPEWECLQPFKMKASNLEQQLHSITRVNLVQVSFLS